MSRTTRLVSLVSRRHKWLLSLPTIRKDRRREPNMLWLIQKSKLF